jgi:type II secretory pathway pseudopilin PulG
MKRIGLTLMERMMVLAILVAIASVAIPLIGDSPRDVQATVTRTNLTQVRDAYVRLRSENPFVWNGMADVPLMPWDVRISHLVTKTPGGTLYKDWNPLTPTGWNGPYLKFESSRYPFPTSGDDAFGFRAEDGTLNMECIFDRFHHSTDEWTGLPRDPDHQRCPLVLVSHTTAP